MIENIIRFGFTVLLLLNCTYSFSQLTKVEDKKVVSDFINYIKTNDIEELANRTAYPFKREYPIPTIGNKQEFIDRYNEVFDDKLKKMITDSNPATDWSAVGWRGIMLFDGDIWLDYDGSLIAVNYRSELEKRKKKELIEKDKNKLYSAINDFKNPVLILKTSKFKIRIDEMNDGSYRYASWPINKEMNEKPDLILYKGKVTFDGSGGNHSYKFKNGIYVYECIINVIGTADTPPASLIVYKGEKEVLKQDAKIIR